MARGLRVAAADCGWCDVGQEGVVLTGDEHGGADNDLEVKAKGVRFVSLHFLKGLEIYRGGSVTMAKCTSTDGTIHV